MIDLEALLGFDWDSANINKNWLKHKVSNLECEQIFLNEPLLLLPRFFPALLPQLRFW